VESVEKEKSPQKQENVESVEKEKSPQKQENVESVEKEKSPQKQENVESAEKEKSPQKQENVESVEVEKTGISDALPSEDKNDSTVKGPEDNGEEEPSNLQLSWEILELAKSILIKQAESIQVLNAADNIEADEKAKSKAEIENMVSDTFQALGELSIENENYAQATEDLETCLKRRQSMLPDDSRSIAETHYQIGVAQGFNLQFNEAVGSFEGAIKVLEVRIERLKSETESASPSKAAFSSRADEIKEIEALIPEIREKIADTKDMKTETFKKLGEKRQLEEGIAAALGSGDAALSNGESSKDVSTISSNLIKKRPATDSADSTEAKKVHL